MSLPPRVFFRKKTVQKYKIYYTKKSAFYAGFLSGWELLSIFCMNFLESSVIESQSSAAKNSFLRIDEPISMQEAFTERYSAMLFNVTPPLNMNFKKGMGPRIAFRKLSPPISTKGKSLIISPPAQ